MKQWNKLGIAVVAIVLAVAAGGGAYAMWGGDDGDGGDVEAGQDGGIETICLEGAEDCEDTFGGGPAGACLEGTEDCVDADLGGDDAQRCLPEAVDCDDTIGGNGAAGGTCLAGTEDCVDADLGGGSLGMCAPGVTDCVDVAVEEYDCAPDQVCQGPDVLCDDGSADGCVVECPEPAPDANLTPEEIERMRAACETGGEPVQDPQSLPPDCAVSSDGEISCPEDQPASNGEGRTEPGSAPSTGAGTDGSEGSAE